MPAVGAAIATIWPVAIEAAPLIAATAGVYAVTKGRSQTKRAEKLAQSQFEAQERQAGEYFDLNREQMAMQARANEIKTLVDVISERGTPAPKVFTLPPAKTQSPIDKINSVIGQLFSRAA